MTMTFSLHDCIDSDQMLASSDYGTACPPIPGDISNDNMHLLTEKLRIPDIRGLTDRPRMLSMLTKSIEQFPATLITGRAGTGKTALAAAFASGFENVCWYSVESSDIDWRVFSRYFSASLPGQSAQETSFEPQDVPQADIAGFLVKNMPRLYSGKGEQKSIIVLDNIHHLFEARWFDDFFNLLIYSLPSETHALLLCRSKPPSPLWRLRSKQMLNVIDEKLIAFNVTETEDLFASMRLPRTMAREAQRRSFGRISKLMQFSEERGSALSL